MRILFAISVLSVCLLLWAAAAVARHICRSKAQGSMPLEPGLFEPGTAASASHSMETNESHSPELVGVSSSHQPTHRTQYASVEHREQH